VVSVRVSRDGAIASAKYEELLSFHRFVLGIIPGILTMGSARGALAHTVKLLATGDEATVSVAATAILWMPEIPTTAKGVFWMPLASENGETGARGQV